MPMTQLVPVTPAKELAMEELASWSSPKCPTNMTDTTMSRYCSSATHTMGPAMYICIRTSPRTHSGVHEIDSSRLLTDLVIPLANVNVWFCWIEVSTCESISGSRNESFGFSIAATSNSQSNGDASPQTHEPNDVNISLQFQQCAVKFTHKETPRVIKLLGNDLAAEKVTSAHHLSHFPGSKIHRLSTYTSVRTPANSTSSTSLRKW